MSNSVSNITNSWSLLTFASNYDRMQVGKFKHVDDATGEVQHFSACIFSEGDTKTFVSFSPKLGELSPAEISAQKNDLQVVHWQTADKDGFTLCKKGGEAWEDVDLF